MGDGAAITSLRASGISRSFAGVQALHDVSLVIGQGEVVGLIGPNGAGKSTLVNVLTGFDAPDTGQVLLGDRDITPWTAAKRGRHGLGRTFQHGHSFGGLSVRENVEVAALGVGATPKAARHRATTLLDLVGLSTVSSQDASGLPHGQERLLGVARALATEPSHVLMDEPAAGLNEHEVGGFADVIRLVRDDRGAGVLLIDHNVSLVLDVSDRIHVLDQGTTLAEGSPDEVRANDAVATAYLGQP